MARSGKLSAQDAVRVGTTGPWIAARAVKGLFGDDAPAKTGTAPPTVRPTAQPKAGSTAASSSTMPASRRVVFRPAGPLPPTIPAPARSETPVRRYVVPMPVESAGSEHPRSVAVEYLRRIRSPRSAPFLIACVAMLLLATGVVGGFLLNSIAVRSAALLAESDPLDSIPALAVVNRWHHPSDPDLGISDVVHIRVAKSWSAPDLGEPALTPGDPNPPNNFVILELEVKNLSKRHPISYSSWNQSLNNAGVAAPVLVDASGFRMGLVPAAQTPAHFRQQIAVLEPNETITDTLVFYAPSADLRRLRLVLPFASFGRSGALGVEIPGSMLEQIAPRPIQEEANAEQGGNGFASDEQLPSVEDANSAQQQAAGRQ